MKENFKTYQQRVQTLFSSEQALRATMFYKLVKYEARAMYRAHQVDENGSPLRVFEHYRGTFLILADEAGFLDFSLLMTGLGHDVLEDTRMSLEEIEFLCGRSTGSAIGYASKCPKAGFEMRLLNSNNWRALVVKIADRTYNLRTLGEDREFASKIITETARLYPAIVKEAYRIIPSEYLHCMKALVSLFAQELEDAIAKYNLVINTEDVAP